MPDAASRSQYREEWSKHEDSRAGPLSLFQSQLQLAQTQGQLYFALINLYKALGGGWVDEAEKLAPKAGVDTTRTPPIFP